ncbi:FtsX-like permease family protein [Halobacillus litoralis]|uniref:FtsX-like permease family protein n=1 Tax=Halobacillus litoralis TaxID=45668 RepID=A0A845DSH4_9BACI|nr:ABC transporter permease [Halobacillus litoralis]MYL20543.1 FtsX-like permease family protein [Halobacillus litoralis]MYL36850.1 FtsX-like permease family protein [Halobacillus litoralis]
MSINQLILRNLKKNLKNYYLYVFALVFSVALYFSFVTLQYDPAMSQDGSVKGSAGLMVASVLLIAIVAVFLLYANALFVKRRSKEIGLFQLIGMTKNRIFRLLTIENLIIYFGSMAVGIFIGFAVSKLILMGFFKIVNVDEVADLHFSMAALFQTLIVFAGIFLLIMGTMYIFIRKQSILSLFRVTSSTQGKVKKLSLWEHIMGVLGIVMIAMGYYVSTQLFEGEITSINGLFAAMTFILASTIIGTYFFYKGSVRFVSNLLRKRKAGYMNINEVLSLSSMMFRMKSNAFLLTVITTVSALSIALLALSYISLYSAESLAENNAPDDFAITNEEKAMAFSDTLEEEGFEHSYRQVEVLQAKFNVEDILDVDLEDMNFNVENTTIPIISETAVPELDLDRESMIMTGYNDIMQSYISLKGDGKVEWLSENDSVDLSYQGLREDYVISSYYTAGGLPIGVVSEEQFMDMKEQLEPSIYTGINLEDDSRNEAAFQLFEEAGLTESFEHRSQWYVETSQKQNMGAVMFIVAFLGLTFLITSGCILYFKQMDEGEDEKESYTVLRKLGFTRGDLLRGIQGKQLFNFGVPLLIGLLHSYFAVKSGWFFFGNEIWTPMLMVMGVYTALYSIFGLLSVFYYKRVIKEAL